MAANVVTGKCCGRNYFLDQITGVLPANSCDSICLTVADPSELPDPADGCEFALVATDSSYVLYEWDGAAWVGLAGGTATFSGGEITEFAYQTTGSWVMTLNGVEVSGDDVTTFDPPIASLDVVFINGSCSYVMDEIVPPVPTSSILFEFDDIANVPVADASDYALWNTWLGVTCFTSVEVTGNYVELFGSVGNDLPSPIISSHVLTINDYGIFSSASNAIVNACDILTSIDFSTMVICGAISTACDALTLAKCDLLEECGYLHYASQALETAAYPSLKRMTSDNASAFYNMNIFNYLELNALESIGSTVGYNTHFSVTTAFIACTIQVPTALQTIDGGNLEGDLLQLETSQNTTIFYV